MRSFFEYPNLQSHLYKCPCAIMFPLFSSPSSFFICPSCQADSPCPLTPPAALRFDATEQAFLIFPLLNCCASGAISFFLVVRWARGRHLQPVLYFCPPRLKYRPFPSPFVPVSFYLVSSPLSHDQMETRSALSSMTMSLPSILPPPFSPCGFLQPLPLFLFQKIPCGFLYTVPSFLIYFVSERNAQKNSTALYYLRYFSFPRPPSRSSGPWLDTLFYCRFPLLFLVSYPERTST